MVLISTTLFNCKCKEIQYNLCIFAHETINEWNMEIKIINKSKHQLPTYATELSAGMDIRANLSEPIKLEPMQRCLIPTGLFMYIPQGYEAQVRPRSGLAIMQGVTVLNSPGTVDDYYLGDVVVILWNYSQQCLCS